jgi:hypothetical protein
MAHASDIARPELPEEKRDPDFILRSNRLSLVLTLTALAGTVVAVYALVPARDNELMTQSAIEHRSPPDPDIVGPTPGELRAWTIGALRGEVPWPAIGAGAEVVGASALAIQKRPAALVRYRVGELPVTLVAQRGRDAVPRKYHRRDGDELVVSWRRGPWTIIAVGPADAFDRWRPVVGAPPR